MTEAKGFVGLRVAAFESRMATEMTRLIERYDGRALVAPALREIPLEDNSAALRFGARLLTERIDILILLTGVGTKVLFDILQTRHPLGDLIAALKNTALVVRGPKPMAALKALGLTPTLTVPEPNTWYDLLATLDEYRPVRGLRVAVQEYGVSNTELLDALRQRGADVFPVPVYRWAL
ncbi:MAG TPA: uroporphyrinogen-III synthase, partial [Nitrospiraceae bacterium]|nr:uroporphyrinogen-III synthase [Nitrospiraceae bacterium]